MCLLYHTSTDFSNRILRINKIFISACLCATIVTGCSKVKETSHKEIAGQDKTISIGLIPERNIFDQIKRYEPVADYLSEKIGIKIKLKVLPQYGNIIDNFVSAKIDGAFFGSFTYALAHAKIGVEVIARPESIDGISTYHGVIFARQDSGIKTAKDMKGKIFVFVDKATTGGYLFPLVYFKEHGIKNYKRYFKETYFGGTHDNTVYDVLNKKADIGASKNTEYERLAKIDGRITKELVVLESSLDVPENGLTVNKDMDDSVKNKIKNALLNMHNDARGRDMLKNFGVRRFIETTDNDYANIYKYVKEINLNLAAYSYINN